METTSIHPINAIRNGVPPSGGSLEIGNFIGLYGSVLANLFVPPSGGSLEIGNIKPAPIVLFTGEVPPSGGSLEIGNSKSSV